MTSKKATLRPQIRRATPDDSTPWPLLLAARLQKQDGIVLRDMVRLSIEFTG